MSEKVKRIIISILMILSPAITIFLSFEDEQLDMILALVVAAIFFLGACLLGLTLCGFYEKQDNKMENVTIVYEKSIKKKGNELTYWEIIRGNLLILGIPTFLVFSMALLEGMYILENAITFYFLGFIACAFFLFVCGKENIKRVLFVDIIMIS